MGGQFGLITSLVLTFLLLLPCQGWAQDDEFMTPQSAQISVQASFGGADDDEITTDPNTGFKFKSQGRSYIMVGYDPNVASSESGDVVIPKSYEIGFIAGTNTQFGDGENGVFSECGYINGKVSFEVSEQVPVTIKSNSFSQLKCKELELPNSLRWTIEDNAFANASVDCITFTNPTPEVLSSTSAVGYSVSMFGDDFSGIKKIIIPGWTDNYHAILDKVAESVVVLVDGGELNLTDEKGLSCEDKTLYRAGNLSYERTLDAPGEYATLCLPFSLNLANTHGIFDKVYVPMNTLIHNTAKSTSELEHFVLMLEEQASDAIIPAGQPIFVKLYDTADKIALKNFEDVMLTADLQPKTEAMKVVDWDGTSGLMTQNKQFSISYGSLYQPKTEVSADDHIWSFNANGSFGPQTSGTMPPFRLFLTVLNDTPSVQAKAYSISIGVSDGTTTGIREIISSDAIDSSKSAGSSAHAGLIYDLNGRKVATASEAKHLSKGIYILSGKKMVVK